MFHLFGPAILADLFLTEFRIHIKLIWYEFYRFLSKMIHNCTVFDIHACTGRYSMQEKN